MLEEIELIAKCIRVLKGINIQVFNYEVLDFWKDFKKNLFVREQFFSSKENLKTFLKQQKDLSICHLIDTLGINYYIVKTYDYICILGPYIQNPIDIYDAKKILKANNFDDKLLDNLLCYYQCTPLVNDNEVLLCAQTIIDCICPSKNSIIVSDVYLNSNTVQNDFLESTNLSVDYISYTHDLEQLMIEKVIQGDSVSVKKLLIEINNRVVASANIDKTDIYTLIEVHAIVRTLLRIAARNSGVPSFPIHLTIVKNRFLAKNITSISLLNNNLNQLVDDICNLVINYRFKKYPPLIKNAIQYIVLNLKSDLSLEQIAKKLSVSSSYLSNLFSKELNITLTEYIHTQRLEYASTLLTCTSLTIQEISSEVGIEDYNYFSKLFKKHYKKTPSEFRKNSN